MGILGGNPVVGVLACIVASIALIVCEYIRLTGDTRWSAYLPLVRIISIAAAFISVVLIASRFIYVWFG